ncbi:MAG: 16S rRNA (cytosine(1402)-N(4))-methyltransferase RsmH [Oligoflexia bacterium]|nr:16S rRNA (cytosine(1402)-N(4))-methyltransferase RsmH [Oligoflexia bacterium]
MTSTVHVPILVEPIVRALIEPFEALTDDAPAHWLVDFTLGGGGHTAALLEALAGQPRLARHRVLALDQDPQAIERARTRFAGELAEGRLEIQTRRFSEAEDLLAQRPILGMMADLGFSSDQMDTAARGLSFQAEGPLDMRLDPTRGRSCREYLTQVSEAELARILEEYGEERFARRIASALVQRRRERKLPTTTKELADLVVHAIPAGARHGRIHAATRTFQALRIQINEEMNELDCLLGRAILFLKPGGRVAILSFHSLEDRKVKQAFRGDREELPPFKPLTKKPLEADEAETNRNPRSRSAKLRVAEKTGSQGETAHRSR